MSTSSPPGPPRPWTTHYDAGGRPGEIRPLGPYGGPPPSFDRLAQRGVACRADERATGVGVHLGRAGRPLHDPAGPERLRPYVHQQGSRRGLGGERRRDRHRRGVRFGRALLRGCPAGGQARVRDRHQQGGRGDRSAQRGKARPAKGGRSPGRQPFEPLHGIQADVVIGDVSGVPDDIAAVSDWFPGGFSGGPTGAEVPVAMLEASRPHLRPGGRLYLPTGSIQDEGAVLRAARRIFGEGRMRQLRERLLPLPAKISENAMVRRLMDSGVVNFIRKGSRLLWELRIWECTLPPSPEEAIRLAP